MNTYSFEELKHIKAGVLGISYLILSFVLITLLAIYTQRTGLCLLIMFVSILAPIIFYKKILPVFEETITINDSGFHIKSQNRCVEWKDLRWFRIDNKTSPLIDIIEFGIDNGRKISFTFYKKTQKPNDWPLFKRDITQLVDQNCKNLKNYYDTKIWQSLIYVIIASWVIIPSVLVGLGFNVVKIIPIVLIYIGSTTPLIVTINNHRKKKINVN